MAFKGKCDHKFNPRLTEPLLIIDFLLYYESYDHFNNTLMIEVGLKTKLKWTCYERDRHIARSLCLSFNSNIYEQAVHIGFTDSHV